ncbi:type VI secretion system protein TssA [Pseudomonas sp. CFBP13528]|uniref:type VI secretion system protein TssA n=1 Tax=Pseudomonas sp. CFBP13528 TaxID=2184006 RepID=UPI0010BF7817|nr:type VI secretion system protein TssA [Pseudomonas sp. CFBP13528]TKK28374.1 type VI secretion system protein TssA [Pseudomonas sp. CFBP13528]
MVHSEKLYAYYQELARTPCSSGNFAGNDVRFSSEFETMETEVAKTQSIHGGSLPNWQQVCDISERMLREQSKDLRAAVWLTWALHQRDSFPGLLAGLGLLVYLCEHHWAPVYPAKPCTRVAALGWLVTRLDSLFSHNLSLVDQLPLFRALHEHLVRLDELLNEHLGSDAPLLLPSRRQLSERLARATQGGVEPAGIAGVIAQVKQAGTQLLKPESPINNEKDAHKALRALQEQARTLCTWWLRQNATDLRALRLGRTLAWLSLVNYPDANSEGVTALRPLAPDKLNRYQDRLSHGHHAELLLELEASLAGALFWFDGLRMVWECLEALHASQAMTELEMSFALLLQRLPNLPELRFDDGTPFAAPATCEWITLHVIRHLHKPESFNAVADVGSEPWEAALQAAMPSVRKEGLKTAVSVLTQGLKSACSERARFHWRLALARLCVRAGKPDLGRIQLEQLDLELQRAGLDRWEPELALHVGRLLYRCYDLLPQSHAVRESKDATHRRLCHFDLEAVLE